MPFKDSKTHYKMYKAGKRWLFSAITVTALSAGFFAFNVNDVHADTSSLSTQTTASSSTDPGASNTATSKTENQDQQAQQKQTVTAENATSQAASSTDQTTSTQAANDQKQASTEQTSETTKSTSPEAKSEQHSTATSKQQSTEQKSTDQTAKLAKDDQAKQQDDQATSQAPTSEQQQSNQLTGNESTKIADAQPQAEQSASSAAITDQAATGDQKAATSDQTSASASENAQASSAASEAQSASVAQQAEEQARDQIKQAAEQAKSTNVVLATNIKYDNGLKIEVGDPDYGGRWVDPDESHYTFQYDKIVAGFNQAGRVRTIVFSTNRNGDGTLYAFELDQDNRVVGSYTIKSNPGQETRENSQNLQNFYYRNNGDFTGGLQTNSSHIRFNREWTLADHQPSTLQLGVENFSIPREVPSTVRYVDAQTKQTVYESHFNGLTGQDFKVTGLPDKAGDGYYYISRKPDNSSGFISPFGKVGTVWTTHYANGSVLKITETDGHGGMDARLYSPDGQQFGETYHIDAEYRFNDKTREYGWEVKNPTNSANLPSTGFYPIYPIYTPQTRNIVFELNKLSKLVPVDKNGTPIDNGGYDVPYTLDPNDPTKANPTPLPNIPGYVPLDPNDPTKTTTPGTPVPIQDPGEETKVPYVVDHQDAVIRYIDDQGTELHQDQVSGKINERSDYSPAGETKLLEEQGYKQISSDFPQDGIVLSYNNGKQLVYTIQFKKDTEAVTDNSGVSNVRIRYIYDDGSQAAPDKTFKFTYHRTGTKHLESNTITWNEWIPDQENSFYVPSPKITGYTADKADVAYTNIPEATNDTVDVVYNANAEKAHVNYVDQDNNGKVITSDTLTGKFGSTSNYSTKDQIAKLEKQGYELVNDGYTPNYKFSTDEPTFTVTLKHKTKTVTPENPGQPGQPVDPNNPDGPKYPNGTDESNLVKNITRTIHYRYADGREAAKDVTETVKYARNMTFDEVTGQITETGNWTSDKTSYDAVQSPMIPGYTPDQATVGATPVTPNDSDSAVTVTYNANEEQAHVEYVDQDEDGKVITSDTLTGKFGSTSDYSTKDQIAKLEKQGYELVNDGYTPNYKFGTDEPTFKVTFKHKTKTVTPENPGQPGQPVDPNNPDGPKYPDGTDEANLVRNISRTIHYRYSDGSEAAKDVTETVKYARNMTFDEVTGKIIATDDWKSDKTSYDAVQSPSITGYTPDKPTVDAAPVTPNDTNSSVTVVYTNNEERARVNYVDQDDNNKVITSDTLAGKFGSTSDYSTKDRIAELEKRGYELVHDGYTPGYKFTTDEPTFTVSFKHKTKTVTPENPGKPGQPVDPNNPDGPKYPDGTDEANLVKNITRTIHYRYADGREAAKDVTESVKYTRNMTFDEVTGKIIETGNWNGDKTNYDAVDSPVIPGYTADQPTVSSATTTPNDSDSSVTVTYNANEEHARVNYVDQDENGKIITSDTLSGKFGSTSDYSTKDRISALEKQGYELVNDGYTPGYKFTTDEPTFTVTLKHKTTTVTPENPGKPGQPVDPNNPDGPKYPDGTDESNLVKNITRTIHYRYADGREAAKDVTETVKYTRNMTFDQVTGKIIETDEWKSSKNSYDAVDSPVISGYTADQPTVGAATTTPEDSDSNVTVTYNTDAERAHVNYVDQDANNKIIKSDLLTGKFGDTSSYSTKDQIAALEKQGYELVHDGYTPGYKFTTEDPTFTVTLKHKTTTVTPENPGKPGQPVDPNNPDGPKYPDGTDESNLVKNITRTIHYRYADGREAAKDVTETVKYTRNMTFDQVTGKIIETGKWTSDKTSYAAVDSPVISGYTADQPTVSATTVTPNDSDSAVTVTYNANEEHAHVNYVDQDANNKIIKSDLLTGKFGDTSSYSTKDQIAALEKQGYELVNDGFKPGYKFTTAEPTFTVSFKHKTTTVTPENPGKPGQPIDPNNPDGPKYPNGTDESNLVKNITRTIHYRLSNGQEAAKDVTETVKYTRNMTFDQVTGKIIETGQWTSQGGSWNAVKSPVVTGYYTRTPLVNAVTVTPETQNAEITVVYFPLGHLVPDVPGTTPETYPNDPNDPSKIHDPLIPDIPGYTPVDSNGNKLVPGDPYPIAPENIGKDTPIHYVKNEVPTKPSTPAEPKQPVAPAETPSEPTPAKTPSAPVQPAAPAAQPSSPVAPAPKQAAPAPHKQVLPQTGESQSTGIMSLIGALLLSFLAFFGYKKKEDK
ncbi:mucin-binding protein [Fructilactobacillus carniphilus]|uniref:MucBP domain-containing protein n=1 Tax=Fructilactobacillus carniphilus TaxID=2940297 RepID=A0ABY5BYC9_9LACO|nr:MucBP domain-containing protein [Fructilactobacillus carniphilus]USS90643.1 MucBP domain-containing protein [Fructilactobacillus carniphilus]